MCLSRRQGSYKIFIFSNLYYLAVSIDLYINYIDFYGVGMSAEPEGRFTKHDAGPRHFIESRSYEPATN